MGEVDSRLTSFDSKYEASLVSMTLWVEKRKGERRERK